MQIRVSSWGGCGGWGLHLNVCVVLSLVLAGGDVESL